MTDEISRIPPQRSRAAVVTALRELADAVEEGKIQYVFYGALNTPESAEEYGGAFRQVNGFVGDDPDSFFWMLPMGMARSVFRDVEEQLLDVAAGTITSLETYKV